MERRKQKPKRERGGATFMCPECNGISRVTRTKRSEKGFIIRERECNNCGIKFETREYQKRENGRRSA